MEARPNPVQWIWYAYGGKLPDRYAEWVLYDVTCRTWLLRHLARTLVQLFPFCVVVMLLPGPLEIRLGCLGMGLFVGVFYAFGYVEHTAEHRVLKHGYPVGMARETRAVFRDARRYTRWAARRHEYGAHPPDE
ncbi:hypothetical protein GIY23_13510 [Allosaccharopolyspora coralli]|uniref:DUF5313 domain-containing protein n=1 Tax=Allosaccharopolyspora coralli TaxID=2665642 RepID=A0A5Q3Q7F0_9PSEU|nr:DUF5313 family protein [Allosaccharopolyspora coralli]QGK70402.1 hypothetical protein GIY23_13510 [Allosaccharopolyspora coralli]